MQTLSPSRIAGPTLSHLEQLIDALIAGVILVDPTGVILGANRAALKMHGVDRAEDLGMTADDYVQRFCLRYRSDKRLARREYPIMRLLAGESFPDLIVEVAPLGQDKPRWVHQVRDVAMGVDGGDPDCLALVIHDVSERYDAEERFEAMFQANPAPAVIIRATDQRFLRVNQGFVDLSGFDAKGLIGKTLFELDIFAGVERRDFVLQQIAAGAIIPQLEAELPLKDGGTKLVLVAGQPIEVTDRDCLLFTFADLEPRRRAESALQTSEEHFATVFQMAPIGMVITQGADYRLIEVNEAFSRFTGYAVDDVIGRVADDLALWGDAAQRRDLEAQIEANNVVRNHDVRILHRNGDPVDCLLSAARIGHRGEPCVMWLYQDITTRRHDELELVEAIEAVMKDANWFGRTVMDKLATLRRPDTTTLIPPPATELSRREREVLGLICQGLDDTTISAQLSLSPYTVRNHVARLYGKIGVNRRSSAILWARQRGLH